LSLSVEYGFQSNTDPLQALPKAAIDRKPPDLLGPPKVVPTFSQPSAAPTVTKWHEFRYIDHAVSAAEKKQ
jgi:hypothetical protein